MKAGQAGKVPIIVGSRVRVVQGRQFQNFGAGDSGLVVHVDKEAGTCDVAFDGREGRMTVAARYLEVDPSNMSKPPMPPQGPTPTAPSAQLLEERLGNGARPRAASNDSSATDPNGRILEGDHRPPPILSGPPDRPSPPRREQTSPPRPPQPQLGQRSARGVAEVLQDVRRVCEARRCGAAALQGSAELRAGEATDALSEVGCLRQAFSELRELILLEAEQRVAGPREVHTGLEQAQAGQSLQSAGSDSLLRAEQQRLEQQQAELLSVCASLRSLKEQTAESALSPCGQAHCQGAVAASPSDWELSVQLPLTVRLNSLDARLGLVDERLSLLGGQVAALAEGRVAVQPQGQGQAPGAGWEQQLMALGSRVDALMQGQAQHNACLSQLQAKFASEVEQAQQALRAETGRLGAQLQAAAGDAIGKVGGDAAGLLKAQADAERDRSSKLLESMQARLDTLSEGLAAEARKREAAVAQVEAQVRRASGEVPLRAGSASAAAGENGSLSKAAALEKPREARVLTADRLAEPRAAQTEKYAGQTLASLATRLPSSDRTQRSRLRAELGSGSSGAGSPRVEKPLTAASLAVAGATQPRTPRSGRPAGAEPDVEVATATATPGSTATATAACVGEEATALAPTASGARVMRMEASPVRQKSAPASQAATHVPQRNVMRAGLVGVDLSHHAGRADLIVSGLDVTSDALHHSHAGPLASPQTQASVMQGAITPSPPLGSPSGPMVVMPPTNSMMSPSVPMMPMHLGNVHGNLHGQPGISGTPGGGMMWPSPLPPSPPSFGPLAPGAFLQPRM